MNKDEFIKGLKERKKTLLETTMGEDFFKHFPPRTIKAMCECHKDKSFEEIWR